MSDDITDLNAWRQQREEAEQSVPVVKPDALPDIRPMATIDVSAVGGRVEVRVVDAYVELEWSASPETAREFAMMLFRDAAIAEAEAGLPARRFAISRRPEWLYDVWLCQGTSRECLIAPPLRSYLEARAFAMVYAAQHGWAYLEEEKA